MSMKPVGKLNILPTEQNCVDGVKLNITRVQSTPIKTWSNRTWYRIDAFAQNCRDSIANALVLLQSCMKPLIYSMKVIHIG